MNLQPWQYIVLLGLLIAVWALALPRRAKEPENGAQTIRNMETALEQFMDNIEADNREMAELLLKAGEEARAEAKVQDARIGRLERQCAELKVALAQASAASSDALAGGGSASIRHHESGTAVKEGGAENETTHKQPVGFMPRFGSQVSDTANGNAISCGISYTAAEAGAGQVTGASKDDGKTAEEAPKGFRGRYKELFELHDGGKSVEAIARKLGMNKGEVLLIVQLARQEESRRV